MGVSRGLLHEANSPHYSHQTLGTQILNTDGDEGSLGYFSVRNS